MGIHKKIFPVAKMPWHDDDHKFGEGEMTWDDVAQKFIPLIEDLEKDWKKIEPLLAPRIDSAIDDVLQFIGDPIGTPLIGTVCLVDNGKCYYCHERAIYAFRSRLYCATCWLELNEDDDD